MVVGSRFLGRFGPGAITPVNRAGNQLLTQVVNLLFGARLTDTQAGFRCVRRSAADRCTLSAARYDIEVDLLLGAPRGGGEIVEVPWCARGPAPRREPARLGARWDADPAADLRRRFAARV